MEKVVLGYEEFVHGLADGTVKFERNRFLRIPKEFIGFGPGKWIVLVAILATLPVIGIPVICFLTDKWFLLLGFSGTIVGIMMAGRNAKTRKPVRNFLQGVFYFAVLPAVLFYFLGIENVFCFISVCFYYQYFFLTSGDIVHDALTKKYLLDSPEYYYKAVESKSIITYRITD